jgi:toxin-antitoxin system PIN domain toxin
MICLPDVNVWIALTSDRHSHHDAARKWLERSADRQLMFCRVTEMGFLRLLTNVHVMGEDALSHAEACGVYEQWRSDRRVALLQSRRDSALSGAE